jgi:hypothetical protein
MPPNLTPESRRRYPRVFQLRLMKSTHSGEYGAKVALYNVPNAPFLNACNYSEPSLLATRESAANEAPVLPMIEE